MGFEIDKPIHEFGSFDEKTLRKNTLNSSSESQAGNFSNLLRLVDVGHSIESVASSVGSNQL